MPRLSRAALILSLMWSVNAASPLMSPLVPPAAAQDSAYRNLAVAKDGQRYETQLKAGVKLGKKAPRDLRIEANRVVGADPRAAVLGLSEAVIAEPKDADGWLSLARALLSIKSDAYTGNERYDVPLNASSAAYLAYERATTPAQKATALNVLHEALKRRAQYRPAIEALKASLAVQDVPALRKALDELQAQHGFRVLDYKADIEAAQPRVCVQFSERLQTGVADFAKFFTVDSKDPQAVTVESKQVCLDGLAHGRTYKIQVREGLPSAVGENLRKSASLSVYVRDRTPSVRVTGRAYVLPNKGQQGVPVVTVNTDSVNVEVIRIGDRALAHLIQSGDFQRQLPSGDVEGLRERFGTSIYKGELAVTTKLNEEVTTAFPVGEAIPELKPGVYALVAEPARKKSGDDDDSKSAVQWFVVTDLGLTTLTGQDGLHTFVRSLATALPLANVNVRLVAKNNEILGTAKTDARGYVKFDPGLKRGDGSQAPGLIAAEGAAGDYAFLDLTASAFDLTDRGVKGREQPGPIDAFAYTDRGVYRPGEDVHLSALVRDRAGIAASVPVTLIISRPDGVEHRRVTLADQGLGGRTTSLHLGGNAMTGTWRAKLHTDPKADAIAQVAFLVEDFVPERLELSLQPATPALRSDAPAVVKLAGRYLYGPPAADLAIEGEIAVKLAKEVAGFAGYRFGLADEKIPPVRAALDNLPTTAKDGRADISITLPPLAKTARPLEADVILKLRETGGRTIERTVTIPIASTEARIGIKPLFANDQIGNGELAAFNAILVTPEGKAQTAALKWELLRLEQRWQWYSRDGHTNYEAVTHTRRIASGTTNAAAETPAKIEAKTDWGRYRLEVSTSDGRAILSSTTFNAGSFADEGADSPEMLDVALDKSTYKPGDIARVKIESRMAGKALIGVVSGGLMTTKEADLPAGGGEIALPIEDAWSPGAYVTVMLYRPMDEGAKRMPSRAIGLRWITVEQDNRRLGVTLSPAERVKSGGRLTVPVKFDGLKPGEDARLTLTAVDLGILNLTRFETPKPEGWFFGQRRLGADIRDFYSRLIDGMRAERGRLRSGGDGGANGMTMQGSPPVEATLALFSGVVPVNADGTAEVNFDLPDFNGSVRLSAVAWSQSKIGSASKDIIVRDPIALTVSAPRFLTLGDTARLEFALHNVEGPAAGYKLKTSYGLADGSRPDAATAFDRTIQLSAGERKRETLSLKPADVGPLSVTVEISGPNGISVKRQLALDVKVPAGDIKRITVSELAAKTGRITLSPDVAQDLIASRSKVFLNVSPHAGLDMPGVLSSLDRYPYGCAEQTTSRALPLLYVNDVARQIGMGADKEIRARVEKAIDRVLEMQDSSGAFGIWGPADGDMWLTSYVTDFLTRAKETGYSVPPRALNQALERLTNFVAIGQDFDKGGEDRAYALYVLARNGRAQAGELRYDVDTRIEKFASPLAQAQIGAALSMMGDTPRAEKAFAAALKVATAKAANTSRQDYGSNLRDGAAVLTLAVETGLGKRAIPGLVEVLARTYKGQQYTSTQEQAWMVLAARALGDQAKDTTLDVNGVAHKGPYLKTLTAAELKADALTITNTSENAIGAVVSVIGAALTPEPAVSRGFTIERSYYTLDGKLVDLKSASGGKAEIKQNERLVAVVKISAPEAGGRILLVDRLPAGLEIENPRLVDSGSVKGLDWLKATVEPEHTEFRDDRFVAAFDFFGGNTRRRGGDGDDADKTPKSSATVAYMVRAVTPGSFVHPAATVEDMYRPDRHARTATGRLDVIAKE